MNRTLLSVLLSLVTLISLAQDVKEYFLPAPEYFNRTFEYESGIRTNDNGEFQTKRSVEYHRNTDGNYKTYTIERSYRYNVLRNSVARHEFYNLRNDRIVNIGNYVEGISDNLLRNGWIDNIESNEIILKPSNSSWKHLVEEETTYYKSRATGVSTKTAYYDNAIEVTQYTDAPSMPIAKKMVTKNYYALGVGLVKSEKYDSGKLRESETIELIDHFSPYSFYQMELEKRRLAEITALKRRIKTQIFPYDSIAPESHSEATYLINKRLNTICQDHSNQYLNIDFEVEFLIDSLGTTRFRKIKGLQDDTEANREIENFLGSFTLPAGEIKGIKCNANFLLKYQYTSVYNEYDFALIYNSKGIKTEVITREENFIKEHLAQNDLPYGKYNLKMRSKTVNGIESKSIAINSYKSFAGAGAFIPSLFIPGIGNRMVTGKGKSGVGITITCYAIVGSGVLTKLASNKQYDLYHKATLQGEIDKYYDKANLYHQVSIGLIGAGSAIWIYNVYRIYRLGKRNRENQRSMEEKITPSLSYTPRNGFQAGLSLKF